MFHSQHLCQSILLLSSITKTKSGCFWQVQVPLHAINQHLVVDKLNALDVGGSITIHAFELQVPLYAINQHLVVDKLNALDVGGSITIHAFGAYYGLAASMVLSISGSGADHHKNGASYTSDMTAMIGTIFLWLFWVSSANSAWSEP